MVPVNLLTSGLHGTLYNGVKRGKEGQTKGLKFKRRHKKILVLETTEQDTYVSKALSVTQDFQSRLEFFR